MSKKPKKHYCNTQEGNQPKKCKNEVYLEFKVKVFHPISGRTSWQTWKLCKKHFDEFHSYQGQGWGTIYKKKGISPVIGYEIPMVKGFIETPYMELNDEECTQ